VRQPSKKAKPSQTWQRGVLRDCTSECEVFRKEKMRSRALGESPIPTFYKRGERSQGLVPSEASAEEGIGAKRRPLTAEGRQPLSLPDIRLWGTSTWATVPRSILNRHHSATRARRDPSGQSPTSQTATLPDSRRSVHLNHQVYCRPQNQPILFGQ
jgi:hypothetical protein